MSRPALRSGEAGAGGLRAAWPADSQDAAVARRIEFQYSGMPHQAETALSGMWLFLATELLFFGGLFLLYMIYRIRFPQAIADASAHAEFAIGTINTVLLLTSSATYAYGVGRARAGDNRELFRACVATAFFGSAFLFLKGYEWSADFDKHLFPGPGFAATGGASGAAQLFWSFYFLATFLHGLHMIVGIALVAWIAAGARRERYTATYATPVEIVGLYWSFVDMVWLSLYPAIYLAGRVGQ